MFQSALGNTVFLPSFHSIIPMRTYLSTIEFAKTGLGQTQGDHTPVIYSTINNLGGSFVWCDRHTYTILYCAGLGPSKDNVCTATTPLSQAIIACLSKGPFGLGDEVNTNVSFFSI